MKGYRVLVLNALAIFAAMLGAFPPEHQAYAVPVLALVNMALRFVTTGPVGKQW